MSPWTHNKERKITQCTNLYVTLLVQLIYNFFHLQKRISRLSNVDVRYAWPGTLGREQQPALNPRVCVNMGIKGQLPAWDAHIIGPKKQWTKGNWFTPGASGRSTNAPSTMPMSHSGGHGPFVVTGKCKREEHFNQPSLLVLGGIVLPATTWLHDHESGWCSSGVFTHLLLIMIPIGGWGTSRLQAVARCIAIIGIWVLGSWYRQWVSVYL
jgi:hypothetical protein